MYNIQKLLLKSYLMVLAFTICNPLFASNAKINTILSAGLPVSTYISFGILFLIGIFILFANKKNVLLSASFIVLAFVGLLFSA